MHELKITLIVHWELIRHVQILKSFLFIQNPLLIFMMCLINCSYRHPFHQYVQTALGIRIHTTLLYRQDIGDGNISLKNSLYNDLNKISMQQRKTFASIIEN